jgi:hypothetical protein
MANGNLSGNQTIELVRRSDRRIVGIEFQREVWDGKRLKEFPLRNASTSLACPPTASRMIRKRISVLPLA